MHRIHETIVLYELERMERLWSTLYAESRSKVSREEEM